MFRERLRASISHIYQALREPEEFALRWHREGVPYHASVFVALALTAIAGTTLYGMTMGILDSQRLGLGHLFVCGLACTAAAGIGWSLPLPALYILNSLYGSRLRASTTFLAALVTTSWGGLAMIASIPVNWFFTLALPYPPAVLVVNLVVFAGVGIAMSDVFSRVMERLEPAHGRTPACWLVLVGAIGSELFYQFGLFNFGGLFN
jgi:hypothetical protein